MPFTSRSQQRWGHTKAGEEALGGREAVAEWDAETKGKKLPQRVSKHVASAMHRGSISEGAVRRRSKKEGGGRKMFERGLIGVGPGHRGIRQTDRDAIDRNVRAQSAICGPPSRTGGMRQGRSPDVDHIDTRSAEHPKIPSASKVRKRKWSTADRPSNVSQPSGPEWGGPSSRPGGGRRRDRDEWEPDASSRWVRKHTNNGGKELWTKQLDSCGISKAAKRP